MEEELASLEVTEQKLADLLDIAAQTMAVLSSVQASNGPKAQELTMAFYQTLDEVKRRLTASIAKMSVERPYEATCYEAFHQLRFTAQKVDLIQRSLTDLGVAANSAKSTCVKMEN